ncbi:unnamed protein product [Rotaria sordida]|uniref:F-box domain-containing protein n=2 Tax=Rotaria sordida TaxID=392033 RepID=A0A814N2U1_9BILA|nr:unnamed protein product [Rotaria sordida]CAF3931255.1 unnamed protein product [Rotaria sordida]
MISSLESFSTELLFDIFEYLSPYDLFRSFINLNDRFNTIVYSYPLHLNFRSISRLEFDYICCYLQPKQVISITFSDETIPHQLEIFKKYFPFFKCQFIHLQSVTFIEIFSDTIDLPESVKCLELRKYDIYKNFHFDFDELLAQQANVLTHLKVDRIGTLNHINAQFPFLTHLTIDGGFIPDEDCYIRFSNKYKNINITSVFQNLGSSITHLYLFIDKENKNMKINLEQFSHCLTHLTLHFVEDIVVSFQSLEQCLINLHQLTHLTLQASGKNDLLDSNQWKNFILKTNIIVFNFKFQIFDHNKDVSILFESFRSSFWLREKRCYIGYYNDDENGQTFLYTIPRFRFQNIIYPSSNFPPITTVPSNIEKYLFYENKIDSLLIDIDRFIIPPIHRFTQVKSLILRGSTLMSLDVLKTIMDLNQIETLDVFPVESLSRHELNILIKHCPRLNYLIMDYNPLFGIPSQIHTLRLDIDFRSLSIDNLWHTTQNVKVLEIPINSKDMMLDIIDQFDHIDNFLFSCDEFSEGDYLEFFIEKLHLYWLEDNSYRLAMNHFTYRQGEEDQQIRMSIGGPKTKKYSDITHWLTK